MSYKSAVLEIVDYIKLEIATIDRALEKEIPFTQRVSLESEKQALKDIIMIIKEEMPVMFLKD